MPLDNFCGCSLLFGVEVISITQIVYSVISLSLASSKDKLEIGGVVISPELEVAYAAWCLLGIPLAISAGVGALYQMPFHLQLFVLYLVGSLTFHLILVLGALYTGVLCSELVSPEVQRLGEHFVCTFVDVFFGFWGVMFLCIQAYCTYAVKSAGDHLQERSRYPELLKAAQRLRSVPAPERPPPFQAAPFVPSPAMPVGQVAVPMPQPVPQPVVAMPAMMTRTMPPPSMPQMAMPMSPALAQSAPAMGPQPGVPFQRGAGSAPPGVQQGPGLPPGMSPELRNSMIDAYNEP
jgi:hypothetical protein